LELVSGKGSTPSSTTKCRWGPAENSLHADQGAWGEAAQNTIMRISECLNAIKLE
jgi:hypothetical protein